MKELNIAMSQLNPIVGDIQGNKARILKIRNENPDVDLIVFAECVLTGYPLEDLVLRPQFMADVMSAIDEINHEVKTVDGPAILYGTPYLSNGDVYNAAVFVTDHKQHVVYKSELPNYDVFDEKRVFHLGNPNNNVPIYFKDWDIGVMICEDTWFSRVSTNLYRGGAEFFISINGSPFQANKDDLRKQVVRSRIKECPNTPVLYVNQVGGQDELVFDGASFVLDRNGELVAQLQAFEEDIQRITLTKPDHNVSISTEKITPYPGELASIYAALMLGIRDYVEKNNFPGVVLGSSGGIDSALSATIATDALGPDKVWTIRLPSRFTSDDSNDFAAELARRLGVRCDVVPIERSFENVVQEIECSLNGGLSVMNDDLWRENTQARLRAVTLLATSNRYGHIVLTNGNRTENSIGYATFGGDTCGGFAPLKDVYKTTVFALAKWRNENIPQQSRLERGPRQRLDVIPVEIIDRPPTAELKEGQTDEAALIPYERLDGILKLLIDEEKSIVETAQLTGEDEKTVARFLNAIYVAEYKRRQTPPGVKIGLKSFGRGRRYPLTNKWRG